MAVKLRLRRMGKKKRPFYRIVVADNRAPRDGRFIELIGTYDPISKPMSVELKEDRVMHWLQNGAQPTDTVKNLFQKKGIWLKWHLQKSGADDAKITEELEKWALVQKEKEIRLQAKEEEKKRRRAETKKKEIEEKGAETEAAATEAQTEAKTMIEEKTASQKKEPKKEETTEEQAKTEEPVVNEESKEKTVPVDSVKEESAEKSEEKTEETAEDMEEKK